MNPQVELNSRHNDEMLLFTLSGVNVSLANAIRRTILSDIPLVVFRTTPYEQNKANIIANTSRLNNEILKQRLSCIPIHIKDIEGFPMKNYQLEVNVENITDTTMYVTTKDFVIKDLITGKPISESKNREIFPANDYTGYFIDFVRLRPKISDEIPGEKINLTCDFSVGTAKEDGMFNAVSTCSYGFTVDKLAQDAILEKYKQTWKDEGKTKEEVDFEAKNWKLLDGLRITTKDSFDFIIQSIGIYDNVELVHKACEILIDKFRYQDTLLEKDELEIKKAENTMSNSFDIILENEDYTIGKVLEYFMYTKFYETKMLTFCGFKMMHPHDSYSIIRVAYKDAIDKSSIKGHLKECIDESIQVFFRVKKEFLKLVKN
jgi:DNA-directed RNA polymerase subunit L/phenylpyruvate tautomerase PptA (4-oxalocrotonate tautomerase family)